MPKEWIRERRNQALFENLIVRPITIEVSYDLVATNGIEGRHMLLEVVLVNQYFNNGKSCNKYERIPREALSIRSGCFLMRFRRNRLQGVQDPRVIDAKAENNTMVGIFIL